MIVASRDTKKTLLTVVSIAAALWCIMGLLEKDTSGVGLVALDSSSRITITKADVTRGDSLIVSQVLESDHGKALIGFVPPPKATPGSFVGRKYMVRIWLIFGPPNCT